MTTYKSFLVEDIFDIINGRGLTSNDIKLNSGEIPVIQGGSSNNGTLGYISLEYLKVNSHVIVDEDYFITLARVGSSGYVTIQNETCAIGDKAKALIVSKKYGAVKKEVYLYLLTCLYKYTPMYSYNNGVSTETYKKHILKLPVKSLSDTEPDWEFMEQYIKEIEKKAILSVKQQNDLEIERLKALVGDNYEAIINPDKITTQTFNICELFGVKRGTRLTTADRVKGETPLVTAGKEKYGISEYIENNVELFNGNTITIDMFGNSFYRGYEYFADDNIIVLENPNINVHSMLYIQSTLSYLTKMYSYSKQFRMKELGKVNIPLPVNKDLSELVPDWYTMEQYIKGIQQKYVSLKEQQNEEELQNLLLVTGLTEEALLSANEQKL